MGEYFKPLRRKVGLIALVMACLLAGWWIKSLSSPTLPYRIQIEFMTTGIRVSAQQVQITESTTGTVTTIIRTDNWFNRLVVPIPYVVIVIPLSLLSAYLLLSKPRQKLSVPRQDVHR